MPWLRPGWIGPWCRAFERARLELVAVRREGRLVGIVPLMRVRGSLRSTTNWHTPEFGLLAEDEAARRALARACVQRGAAQLGVAFASDAELAELREAAGAAGHRVLERTLERSPYVPIDSDWETYLDTRDHHALAELRRRRRRLEEAGQLVFSVREG